MPWFLLRPQHFCITLSRCMKFHGLGKVGVINSLTLVIMMCEALCSSFADGCSLGEITLQWLNYSKMLVAWPINFLSPVRHVLFWAQTSKYILIKYYLRHMHKHAKLFQGSFCHAFMSLFHASLKIFNFERTLASKTSKTALPNIFKIASN